jgi:hypothetical protein
VGGTKPEILSKLGVGEEGELCVGSPTFGSLIHDPLPPPVPAAIPEACPEAVALRPEEMFGEATLGLAPSVGLLSPTPADTDVTSVVDVILAGAGLAVVAEEVSEESGAGTEDEVVVGGPSGAVFEGGGVGSEDEGVGGGGDWGWEGDGDGGVSALLVLIRIKWSRDRRKEPYSYVA